MKPSPLGGPSPRPLSRLSNVAKTFASDGLLWWIRALIESEASTWTACLATGDPVSVLWPREKRSNVDHCERHSRDQDGLQPQLVLLVVETSPRRAVWLHLC